MSSNAETRHDTRAHHGLVHELLKPLKPWDHLSKDVSKYNIYRPYGKKRFFGSWVLDEAESRLTLLESWSKDQNLMGKDPTISVAFLPRARCEFDYSPVCTLECIIVIVHLRRWAKNCWMWRPKRSFPPHSWPQYVSRDLQLTRLSLRHYICGMDDSLWFL